MNINIRGKAIPLLLTGSIILAGSKYYQDNRVLSYEDLTNPKNVASIGYYDYRKLSLDEFKKILETDTDNEQKFLIEYSIEGNNEVKRFLFSRDYILENPNYLRTEELSKRSTNMLKAIEQGTIKIHGIWEEKWESTSSLDIEKTFLEENLCNQFNIKLKNKKYTDGQINVVRNNDGNFQFIYSYTKMYNDNNGIVIEELGPEIEKTSNKDTCQLDDFAYLWTYEDNVNPFINGTAMRKYNIKKTFEINVSFEDLKNIKHELIYVRRNIEVTKEELNKILNDDNIFDCNIYCFGEKSFYLESELLYKTTKRKFVANYEKEIKKIQENDKISKILVIVYESYPDVSDELNGKNILFEDDNAYKVAYPSKDGNSYTLEFLEKKYDQEYIEGIKEKKVRNIIRSLTY